MKVAERDERESGAIENPASQFPAAPVVHRVWRRPAVTMIDLMRTMAAPGGYLEGGSL